MRISELSKLTNVSIRSIRHYDNKGLLLADRLENDYRDFNDSAVEQVKTIQLYLKLGLTVEEIGALFKSEVADPDEYEYCEEMMVTYEEKLSTVNHQIEALHGLKRLLERQIAFTSRKKKII
ncbi:MerR family transcriptional regulator [Paenibacillus alginolyticus]|uniref:MerR family transcriptional regulator n=1 Tax=Paenibacillus alginolyticus TaxID=59839 RepID=A0ABT4GPW3_9BACL|nr:MerR family transcriptional regulator [Paenibacillus alginolyticus]MCY9670680.1 MerR family transcriptional regulator [Paenibacillus alginolyticus]MCY9698043.1 MerR family transcriptional regulator [Paenibacillus alginolyticus]MEC0148829.1 MerR family transcriptional regulator [Paenibacillus alginolyticus]